MSAPCPDYGFVVRFELLADADGDRFLDEFVSIIESRGLLCGGGGDRRHEYVVAAEAGQATDADREAILAWLRARDGQELATHQVGPLIDLESEV